MNKDQESLKLLDTIKLEVSASFAGNAKPDEKKVNRLVETIREFMADKFDDKEVVNFSDDMVSKNVKEIPYIKLAQLRIPVPRGMRSDYVTYGKFLLEAMEEATDIEKRLISPINSWILLLVGSPKEMGRVVSNKFSFCNIDKKYDELHKVVSLDSRHSDDLYGNAINRNNDWPMVFKLSKSLSETSAKLPVSYLQTKLKEVTSNSNLLVDKITEFKDVYDISPDNIEAIATTVHSLAVELEYISILKHLINSYNESLKALNDYIKEYVD